MPGTFSTAEIGPASSAEHRQQFVPQLVHFSGGSCARGRHPAAWCWACGPSCGGWGGSLHPASRPTPRLGGVCGRIRSAAGVGRQGLRAVGDRRGEKRLRSADRFVLHFSAMRAPVPRALGTFADQPSRVSEGGVRAPLEKLVTIVVVCCWGCAEAPRRMR